VRYGTAIGALNTRRTTSSTYIFLPGLSMTTYYFQVRAEDAAGNSSPFSSAVSGIVRDDVSPTLTTPVSVDQGTATASSGAAAPNGRIDLTWTAPTQNIETITCDPAHTLLRDLDGYRIYRSESPSAGPGSPMVDETVQKTTAYSDASVVNCRDYYYFINAVDLCDHESVAWASSINGRATSGIAPMPPASANATRVSATQVQVTWASVTMDVVNNPIMIDTYEVWRAVVPDDGADPYSANYSLVATVAAAATSWLDTSAPAAAGGRVPYYKVRAKDDCPNYSDFSAPAGALCPFSGTVTLSPGDGAVVNLAPRTVTVTYSGSETLVNCQLVVTKVGGSQDFDQTIVGAGPVYTFTWMPGQGTGSYVAVGIVMNGVGCTGSATGNWSVITACPGTLTLNPASGSTLARQPQTLTSVYSGSDTMTSCRLEITKSGASVDFDQTIVGPGPTYVFTWTPSQGPGTYTARTTSTGVSGCTLVAIQTYRVIGEVVCCLSVDPGSSTFSGSGNDMDRLAFVLRNTGGCTGSVVEITQMVVGMGLDETSCAGPPRLERIEAPPGTAHFTSATGLSLPAIANLFPTFTVNNSSYVNVELNFLPNWAAIGCRQGGNDYRDRLTSEFTFNRVGVIERVTCTTSDIPKINNGSPTP
jgi:hypothetical protein